MKRSDDQFNVVHCFKTCVFVLSLFLLCFSASANEAGKVSVIIPVYNVEKYIKECLDSVINQTYKNLEIICVDDCGADRSIKIVNEYAKKDERIKIFHHDRNMGSAITRNTGVQNSTGEYIFFLDSDDYLSLDIIELMVKKQKETDADVVVSSFRNFVDEKITCENIPKVEAELRDRNRLKSLSQKRYQIDFDYFQDNLDSIFCAVWGKLYRKDFLIKNNIWHINKNIFAEDAGFWLKVLSNFPSIFCMNEIGVNYRMNLNSITMNLNSFKIRTDTKIMLEDFFQYLDQQFKKDKAEKLKELTMNSSSYKIFFISDTLLTILRWIIKIVRFFG